MTKVMAVLLRCRLMGNESFPNSKPSDFPKTRKYLTRLRLCKAHKYISELENNLTYLHTLIKFTTL